MSAGLTLGFAPSLEVEKVEPEHGCYCSFPWYVLWPPLTFKKLLTAFSVARGDKWVLGSKAGLLGFITF